MQDEEILCSQTGVKLIRAQDHGVIVYLVISSRVPGMQAFHNLHQAFEVYRMELSSDQRTRNGDNS